MVNRSLAGTTAFVENRNPSVRVGSFSQGLTAYARLDDAKEGKAGSR